MRNILISLAINLFCLSPVLAEDARKPDAGGLNDRNFRPSLDAVCGSGTIMGKGCNAIRAREIVDAQATPWNALGRVNYASIQTRQHCTGTLVAPRLVLTASHCLYSYARKSWIPPSSIRFVAGYQRGSFGGTSAVARYILDPVQDAASRDFRAEVGQDWAILVLEKAIPGPYPEVLLPDVEERPGAWLLAGYTGLRPHVLSLARDCGAPVMRAALGVILNQCSAMHGDSGAPLLIETGARLQLAGIFSAVSAQGDSFVSIAVPVATFAAALQAEMAGQP